MHRLVRRPFAKATHLPSRATLPIILCEPTRACNFTCGLQPPSSPRAQRVQPEDSVRNYRRRFTPEVNQGILWRLVISSLELSWKSTTHWDVKLPDRVPDAPALHGSGDHALEHARRPPQFNDPTVVPTPWESRPKEAGLQSSEIPPVGSGWRHDIPKGVIEGGERRTWASWVNRRTNRGQRTRRDSRTECPVWKTSPNSRSSGATNE